MPCTIDGDWAAYRKNGLTKVMIAQINSFYDRLSFNESNLNIMQIDEIQGIKFFLLDSQDSHWILMVKPMSSMISGLPETTWQG